jgi:hypothetical protein
LYDCIQEYDDDFCVSSKSYTLEQRKAKQCKPKKAKNNLAQKCNDSLVSKKATLEDHTPSKNKMYLALPERLANDDTIKDIMNTMFEAATQKGLHGGGRVINIHYLPKPKTEQRQRVSCIITISSEQAVNDCLKVKYCLKEYMKRNSNPQQEHEYIFIDKQRTKQEIETIRHLKNKLKQIEGIYRMK